MCENAQYAKEVAQFLYEIDLYGCDIVVAFYLAYALRLSSEAAHKKETGNAKFFAVPKPKQHHRICECGSY